MYLRGKRQMVGVSTPKTASKYQLDESLPKLPEVFGSKVTKVWKLSSYLVL